MYILSVRDVCREHDYYQIANGNSIRLWHDPWLDSQILYLLVDGFKAENPLGKNAKLNLLISNGTWAVSKPHSSDLRDFYSRIPNIPIDLTAETDVLC